ncbi:MAG TPA: ABC transporter substrate-binding protein, partial [Anaerolineae bacterium]|nr:ABC transporter substrate-binding protein [Anaerolineae bacterium]
MKRYAIAFNILMVLTMLLSACGGTATPEVIRETVEVVKTVEVTKEVVVTKEVLVTPESDPNALPRKETLYFNGQQWGPVVGWNPYSSSMNNAMALAAGDNARVTMFETPYLYNMLDGKQYPLLADGPWSWNADMTEITFKIKPAAKWSDGTPVTAEDVAYTWATHVKYNTPTGAGNKDYIEDIVAKDDRTV